MGDDGLARLTDDLNLEKYSERDPFEIKRPVIKGNITNIKNYHKKRYNRWKADYSEFTRKLNWILEKSGGLPSHKDDFYKLYIFYLNNKVKIESYDKLYDFLPKKRTFVDHLIRIKEKVINYISNK